MTWSTLKVRNIQVKKDEFKFCLATHIYLLVNEFLLHHIGLLLNFRTYACGAIQLVNQFHVMSYGNGRITYVMLGTRRFIPQKVWINPLFYLFIYFFFFWNALIFRERRHIAASLSKPQLHLITVCGPSKLLLKMILCAANVIGLAVWNHPWSVQHTIKNALQWQ